MLKKYGVENPFEVDDFVEKARNTNLILYYTSVFILK